VTWADIEYYKVHQNDRPFLYPRVPAFMRVDPFDKIMPSPVVFFYLWHRLMQRSTSQERMLSDYLLAVAETEWTAYNAATWIQQIALGRRMTRLPSAFQTAFRKLGLEAPLASGQYDWTVSKAITPRVYENLLDAHDAIDWEHPKYALHDFSGGNVERPCQWVPFDLYTESVDWGSPAFGLNMKTRIEYFKLPKLRTLAVYRFLA